MKNIEVIKELQELKNLIEKMNERARNDLARGDIYQEVKKILERIEELLED